jgi:glycosyltransferase involved in cell wall biosynthesis
MNVLHVIAGAEVGGAETFAQDAIVALAGRGVRQRVIARPWRRAMARYAEAGIPAGGLNFSRIDRVLLAGRRIRGEAEAFRADLVHAWMSRAASFIPKRMPCPVLGWFGDLYDLKYFRTVDACVGVTPDIAAYLRGQGVPPERVFMVNTFGTMPAADPVQRASLDTPADALAVLVLSRMHAVKGIDTMLRALARVPGVYLWLAGEGPARGEYERLAQSLGLGERVRFLGWRDDRRALLEACDIVALPSRYEPFGTVIVEAWAMRRPLLATLADGARQYVTDGVTGITCPVEDVDALAAGLARLAADPGLRARLAAAGYAAYQAGFTREIVTDRLIACYESCIALGRRT